MKKLPLLIVAVAFAVALLMGNFQQTQGLTSDNQQKKANKVGLIDMAKVFKEYEKFTLQREKLKDEIELKRAAYKGTRKQIDQLKKKISDPLISSDSPEKRQWEKEYFDLNAQYQSKLKQDEIEFMRREAKIYKEIYQEVQDAVKLYAGYYGYSLVLRYSSEGLEGVTGPRKILEKMNRLVVYNSPEIDITEPILMHLNKNFRDKVGGRPTNRRN